LFGPYSRGAKIIYDARGHTLPPSLKAEDMRFLKLTPQAVAILLSGPLLVGTSYGLLKLWQGQPIDFTPLATPLANRNWAAADQAMLQIVTALGRQAAPFPTLLGQPLDQTAIARFRCDELQKLDQLWQQASQNRFGLTAQLRIWRDSQLKRLFSDGDRMAVFVRKVSWLDGQGRGPRVFSKLDAPPGHLPSFQWMASQNGSVNFTQGVALWQRFEMCNAPDPKSKGE
jgi:hypothetical protein